MTLKTQKPLSWGQRVRIRMVELGLKQYQLARRAGVDETRLSNWITRGLSEGFPLAHAQRLAQALEMPFDELFQKEDIKVRERKARQG